MKLKFNGLMQTKGKSGCLKCGQKSASTYGMVTSKMFILPSGRNVQCVIGREIDVNESDAEFLLSYRYTDKSGKTQPVFTKVEDE